MALRDECARAGCCITYSADMWNGQRLSDASCHRFQLKEKEKVD
jgi:hypothetical protein